MLTKIFENTAASIIILAVRIYVGIWFLHHVIAQSLYLPKAWIMMGSALKYFGINFLPQVWGFIAVLIYVLGSLLLLSGVYLRLAAAGMAIVMIVAANMHFSLGQGFAVAKHALTFLIIFLLLIWTGPGKYTLNKYLKKLS